MTTVPPAALKSPALGSPKVIHGLYFCSCDTPTLDPNDEPDYRACRACGYLIWPDDRKRGTIQPRDVRANGWDDR